MFVVVFNSYLIYPTHIQCTQGVNAVKVVLYSLIIKLGMEGKENSGMLFSIVLAGKHTIREGTKEVV